MEDKKNLLVITDGFPQIATNKYNCSFVKNYVDLVKNEFSQIFVISPQPYFPKVLSKIKLFKNFTNFSGFTNYAYDNVKVYYPSFFMIPIKRCRQKRGEKFANKCDQIIKDNNLKFDLIHTHFLFPSAHAGLKLKEIYQKPVVATAHGSDTYKDPFLSEENLERTKNILKNVNVTTIQSGYLENIIRKINPKSVTKIVPNFVDTECFVSKPRQTNKVKTILMVNNLIESKGVLDIVPTVKELLKIRQDFVIDVIGTGYLENTLKQEINQNKLEKYIHLIGAKQNHEIVKYYNEANVFFFPSRAENFPIVQLEALACGVPIVAAPNEGSKFMIKDSLGYLSPDFSIKNYADLLNQALNKKWDTANMRKHVVDNFSKEKVKAKLINVYKDFLEK